MDKAIEKKRWTAGRLIWIFVGCAIVGFLAYMIITRSGTTRLKVDSTRLTVSKVKYGEMRDYYPFEGSVEPIKSVYLDAEEGGRVEEIFVEDGQAVQKDDLILRLSNRNTQKRFIQDENELIRSMDSLQNSKFDRAQTAILNKQNLLEQNYSIMKKEEEFERYKVLKAYDVDISEKEFKDMEDELKYMKDKRELLREKIRQENLLIKEQIEQNNKSLERINRSFELLEESKDSLNVRASISGYLLNIDAEVGENIPMGKRIGRIDVLDEYKIVASVEDYYNNKVVVGVRGKYTLEGKSYEAEVKKVYPIVGGQFYVEMKFVGEMPKDIKRGQRLTVELNFSESKESLMVKNGGFNQEGGRWVYLISEDGKTASKTDIRKGRENPAHIEIIEGLKEGDWVITSGYDTFKEADKLIFNEPVDLTL